MFLLSCTEAAQQWGIFTLDGSKEKKSSIPTREISRKSGVIGLVIEWLAQSD